MCLAWGMPGAPVLIGGQRASFVVRDIRTPVFPDYRNNGFSQRTRQLDSGMQITVEVDNHPLNARLRGRRPLDMPAHLAGLARRLDQAAQGRLVDQVEIIFHWMRNEIAYTDEGPAVVQDAESVLARKSGNCVGFCNAAMYLISKLGVASRAVTGVAYKDTDSVKLKLEGLVLHRWIEVDYPDIGRVFCDPSGKIHFVEATYVVLAVHGVHDVAEGMRSALGGEIELIALLDGMKHISNRNDIDGRISVRPNSLVLPQYP